MEEIKQAIWSDEIINNLHEVMLEKTDETSAMWFQIESIIAKKCDTEG
ncbi:hypothetical protein ABE354_08735 [Brevibacillus laterosporus]